MSREPFHRRLKELIGDEYGAKVRFARALSITPQHLNDWLSGRSKPGSEFLPRIVRVTGVSYEWLLEGKGEKVPAPSDSFLTVFPDQVRDPDQLRQMKRNADAIAIPCPVLANAGEPIIPEDHLEPDSEKYYLFRRRFLDKINRAGNFICVVVDPKEGRSMKPTLAPGDLLLVDRNLSAFTRSRETMKGLNGKIVLLADPDDHGLFVKRIWIDQRGHLVAQSDNPRYPARLFDLHDRKIKEIIAGRVVWRGHEL